MKKERFIKKIGKKEWLFFETIVLFSACILPFLVKLLIKDPLPPFDTDFWSYLLQSVLIMMSLNLGFMLWKNNEWYKLWGWFFVAFFICSFVISNVYALTSIRIYGYDGWMFFWGLFAFVFLIYSSIIAAPLAAIAAFVNYQMQK